MLEQPGEVRRAVEAELHGERAGARDVLARQGGVDLDPLRGGAGQRRELHGDIDAAALEPALHEPTHVELEGGERARQA